MTSAQSLYEQTTYFNDFLIIYATVAVQVISIAKPKLGKTIQNIFDLYQNELKYPLLKDKSFKKDYDKIKKINDDVDKIIIENNKDKINKTISNFDCIKGTRDFLPDDMRIRNWLFEIWNKVANKFAFEEYDFPILEPFDLYARKNGEDIEKEMYVFNDNGGNKLAIIPEATPSLARLVLKNGLKSNFPLRWYTIANCWRYETNTKTRKRQFFQWNMDIIGMNSIVSQADLLLSIIVFLKEIGIKEGEVEIRINSRKIMQSFLDSIEITNITQVCLVIDKILKVEESVILNILQELDISKEKAEKIIEFSKYTDIQIISEKYPETQEALKEIKTLFDILNDYSEWIKFDTSIIRGLSYYSGIVFEVYAKKLNIPRAIAGGVYESLFSMFEENKKIPSIGYGMGDVVILEVLKEMKRLPTLKQKIDYYIMPFNDEYISQSFQVANLIRNKNKSCLIHNNQKMKKKNVYAFAEKIGALNTIFIAPEEWKEGKICVKDLSLGKYGKETQKVYTLEEFSDIL
jgi:histidyl-tRNA synthetase